MRLETDAGEVLPRDGVCSGHLLVKGLWVVGTYEGGIGGRREDGWFDTGDIATIDPDGYMEIVDRSKDVIKSGGEWISSIALENAMMAHPGIREAAAIGIPDVKWSERPALFCVLKPGSSVTASEVRTHLENLIPHWWLPEVVSFVESLPHGATGKVLKTELRAQYSAQTEATEATR